MPPAVSTENDIPGSRPDVLPASVSFMKVNPDMRQKGRSTAMVTIRPAGKEGVSPGCSISLVSKISIESDSSGAVVNRSNVFPKPVAPVPRASDDPRAETMSQAHRNAPAMSSYPPVMFIISLSRRS